MPVRPGCSLRKTQIVREAARRLMAHSGHTSARSPARYVRVSAEALARHQAERQKYRLPSPPPRNYQR
jgi:hypothetical protein